jgi:hypothetical protein
MNLLDTQPPLANTPVMAFFFLLSLPFFSICAYALGGRVSNQFAGNKRSILRFFGALNNDVRVCLHISLLVWLTPPPPPPPV